ncbi:MAG: type II toxin-antitoxin system prevent-host-death family antitoxin [Thermoanaerobacteraceae bacterium]|nr:type II toxin-antitoxin system prevent-host-death family antitoxin [Thermoanaerobacteraceae bacterium]
MRFVSVRDLRLKSGEIWRELQKEGDLVITSNGKPVAVLSGIEANHLEEYLRALRRARATLAVNKIQERSRRTGLDGISQSEIEAEIRAARQNRTR